MSRLGSRWNTYFFHSLNSINLNVSTKNSRQVLKLNLTVNIITCLTKINYHQYAFSMTVQLTQLHKGLHYYVYTLDVHYFSLSKYFYHECSFLCKLTLKRLCSPVSYHYNSCIKFCTQIHCNLNIVAFILFYG